VPRGDVEVFHEDAGWRLIEGERVVPSEREAKDKATAPGRDEGRRRGVEPVVREVEGSIGERGSAGNGLRNVQG
jgi:hypothetical protein